jgi:protein subunit release factor B
MAERSQGRNRELAIKMLKAKLYQVEQDKKRAEMERSMVKKAKSRGATKFALTFFSRIKW